MSFVSRHSRWTAFVAAALCALCVLLSGASRICSAQTLKSIGVPPYHPGIQNNPNSPWTCTTIGDISADGSRMVGIHGLAYNKPWRWEKNGTFEYLSTGGNVVRMSQDGRTIILSANGGLGYDMFVNGELIKSFPLADPSVQDMTANGNTLLGTRSDFSLYGDVRVSRWTNGIWTPLPIDLPVDDWSSSIRKVMCSADGTVIAGNDGNFPYLWKNNAVTRLIGITPTEFHFSQARAISDDGRVVVGFRTYGDGNGANSDPTDAIRWVDGVEHVLPKPANWYKADACAVSGDGSIIVGRYLDPDGYYQAFLWSESTGMVRLLDYFRTHYGIDTQYWWLNTADAISSDGKVICGIGWEPEGTNILWRFEEGQPLEFTLDPEQSIYKKGESFVARVAVRNTLGAPATYTFPDGPVVETVEEPRLLIRKAEIPESYVLDPDNRELILEVPIESLHRGATRLRTTVKRTDQNNAVKTLTAELPVMISPLEAEVKVTPEKPLLNQTPESKWGERAKIINGFRRIAGQEPYANLVEIELKVRNEGDEPVQTVNLPGAVDALSFITSTDPENPGVPLTPIRFYTPDGKEIDLTNPNADPTVDSVTLDPGEDIIFAWVLNAFDANPNPESDDGAQLEFEALVIGGLDGQEVRILGTKEFEVIDRPLLEWGIRPKEGRTTYISGQAVRIEGYLENISTRDDKPPQNLRVRLYQMPDGNLGGGFMTDPANPGNAKIKDIIIFDLPAEGPRKILNLSAIMRSIPTVFPSDGKVKYGVQVWTVRADPAKPRGEDVQQVLSQAIIKEEWMTGFDVTFAANRAVYTSQEECYKLRKVVPELSGIMPFFCGMEEGALVDFPEGFIGLGQFLMKSGHLTADAGVGSFIWGMHNFKRSWDAIWGDAAARQALVQEAYVQYRTLVEMGVMAGTGLANAPMAIEAFELKMIDSMGHFFEAVEKGNVDELQFAAGKFLGSNPDLLLEPLIVARNYQRMTRAAVEVGEEVVDSTIRAAARAEEARKAATVEQRLATAVAEGKPPASGLLPGDVLSDSKLLDIFGVTREQREALQEIAQKFKVNITFRSRNPLSVKLLKEKLAWPKPQALKHKTVNQIDIDFLGYRNESKATLEMVEPPAGLLGPNGRALTGGNLEAAIKNEIEKHRAKIGNNKVLEKEVEERMQTRAEEWNKLFLDKVDQTPDANGVLNQKITTAFEAELQYLPGERDQIKKVGAVEERTVTYELVEGREPRTWKMKMTGPNNGPAKAVTGDVDFLGILDETNNMIRDEQLRREIYTHLATALDMQHGESFTFFLQKARKEYLEECTLGKEGAQAMVSICGFGDAVPRAAYFKDNLSIIDGGSFFGNAKWLPKRLKTKLPIIDYWLRPGLAKDIRRADPSGEFMLLDGVHIPTMPNLDFVNRIITETLQERFTRYFTSLEFFAPLFLRKVFDVEDKGAVFSEGADAALIQAYQDPNGYTLRVWNETQGWVNTTMEDIMARGSPNVLEMKPMTLLPLGANKGDTRIDITDLAEYGIPGDSFNPGDVVVINPGMPNQEIVTVRKLGSLIFPGGLKYAHDSGEMVASLGPDLTDRDHDGLTGLNEIQIGTDPDIADSDGDGLPDGVEVTNGYDPTNSASGFDIKFPALNAGAGTITISWNGQQGREYVIESSTILGADDWAEVAHVTGVAGLTQSAVVPLPSATFSRYFFRVRLIPLP
ncbi:MAG TPA: hypothetical protein VG796_27175 [Verrucomicrobiales bacterium]|nr:hypothetical protein [Verrucomicrobiales bacterium]